MNHYELLVRWGPNHTNQLHDHAALLQAAWCSWLSRQGHILMVQPLDLCLKRCEQNKVMQHHNVLLQIATPTYNLQKLSREGLFKTMHGKLDRVTANNWKQGKGWAKLGLVFEICEICGCDLEDIMEKTYI